MADVSNSFEGGTPTATITTGNSGGASGTAFNFVSATGTFTATAYRGSVAGQFATGGTAATSFCEYTTAVGAASSGAVYGRCRFRLPVLPPDSTGVRVMVLTDGAGSFRAELRVTNTGAVSLRGSAGTVLASFTATYTAGTWWDVGLAITTFSTTVGVVEARKWNALGGVEQSLASSANQNTTGGGGTNKCQAGMIRSLANFTTLIDDIAWSTSGWPSLPVAASVAYGPWSGGVTDTSITAAYVLGGVTSARLVVSTAVGLTSPVYSSAAAPDSDGMVQLTVTGLTAATQYYYGVEADGTVLAAGRGQVRTFPAAGSPADFSVGFGSCQFDVPSDSTFAAVAARTGVNGKALQLIHMGDMNYRDWSGASTATDIFNQHMTSLGSGSMAPMLAQIPLAYLWDNHDWGGDTSDKTAAAGNLVAAAYRKVFPHYTLPATDGRGGHQTWVIGRVRFIQLDVRSYRDPQSDTEGVSKTMLGSEQKQWLKDQLITTEPVKIICGNYPWRDDGDGSGRWGSYSDEFAELTAYINANVPGRVYVIFGDRHFLAADDGSGGVGIPHSGGAPFQQATVAVTGSWSAGSYTTTPSVLQAYGWLDITDDGNLITIDYSGTTTLDGVERVAMTTVIDTLVGTSTLVDTFTDGTVDTGQWPNSYGTYSETGGRARVEAGPGYSALMSARGYTLDSFAVQVFATPAAGVSPTLAATGVYFRSNSTVGTDVGFGIDTVAGTLRCESRTGFSDPGATTLTYDPVAHGWVRLRQTGGNVLWETSPNGTTWTVRRTLATPAWVAAETTGFVLLEGHLETADSAVSYAEFDNVNTVPAVTHNADAPFTGTGAATAAAAVTREATVSLSGTGALNAAGAVDLGAAPAALSGTGALTAGASIVRAAAAPAAGTGALTATAAAVRAATAPAAGTGALTAAGQRTTATSPAAAGTGALTAEGTVVRAAAAAFTGTSTLTAQATSGSDATATASGTGALTTTATAVRAATAPAAGTGGLTAAGTVVRAATAAAFTGTAALAVDLTVGGLGIADATGTGALTTTATVVRAAAAPAAGTGGLTAAGTRSRDATATSAGQGALSGAATRTRSAAVTAAGTGALTATATRTLSPAAPAAGVGALHVTASVVRAATVAFTGTSTLTPGRTVDRAAEAAFTGTGSLRELTRVPPLTGTATVATLSGTATVATLSGTATTR